ncbi:MAG TPA: hypothetical protein VF483_02110 [Gemmatimonadaceae bacterium]
MSDLVEKDMTPPSLTIRATPTCLWPPNHKLVVYNFTNGLEVVAKDECDAMPVVKIMDVTSNQDVSGDGSGKMSPDVSFGDHAMCVRATRAGMDSSDRIYTVHVQATDAGGNATTKVVTILVPHDQGEGAKCEKIDKARVVADGDTACVAE